MTETRHPRLAMDDELLDAQLLRTVGAAPYGGADVGECLATARTVQGTDLDGWYSAWTELATTTAGLAESARAAGRVETARAAFFRASNYHRNAGVLLMGTPIDPRLRSSNAAQTTAFRQGAALLAAPPEVVAIPFEGTTLPGYHFRAAGAGPRPTAILLGGYDGTAEELYFFNGVAALARGYDVLAFDGPGQGAALIQQGLVLRADYGPVVGAVVDFLLERPDVDPDRLALIGLSLGGFLAPRAAATSRGSPRASPTAARSTCSRARWNACPSGWPTGCRRASGPPASCSAWCCGTSPRSPRPGGRSGAACSCTGSPTRWPTSRPCATTRWWATPSGSPAPPSCATPKPTPSAPRRRSWPRRCAARTSSAPSPPRRARATTARRAPARSSTPAPSTGSTGCWPDVRDPLRWLEPGVAAQLS